MAVFERVGVTFGGDRDQPVTHVLLQIDGNGRVILRDYDFGASRSWNMSGDQASHGPRAMDHAAADRIAVSVNGRDGALLQDAVAGTFNAWNAGVRTAETMYLGQDAHGFNAITALGVVVGGQEFLFLAPQSGNGLTGYRYDAGVLSNRNSHAGPDATSPIMDMAAVETGNGTYLFAAAGDGITAYRIQSNGGLDRHYTINAENSLPVSGLTALDVAEVGGEQFLIAAAAGTSSLTVFRVSRDGSLTVTDHILDGRDTRFEGVSQLDVVQMGEHSFILVSGMDGGLSMFRLTQDGQLVHADTVADSVTTSLQGISGIEGVVGSRSFDVLTTSATEAGMTQFRVDFDPRGIVATQSSGTLQGTNRDDMLALGQGSGSLFGRGGDDILSDGAGSDRMDGGAGADTFVMARDGQRDRIDNFDISQDLLDLSAWRMLRSVDQLDIRNTGYGVLIQFGDEILELHTIGSVSLSLDQIESAMGVFLSHVDVVLGPRRVSDAQPPDVTPPPVPDLPDVTPDVSPDPEEDPDVTPPPDPDPGPDPQPDPDPDPTPPPSNNSGLNLDGDDGNNRLIGSHFDDGIAGGGGNDTIEGRGGDDLLAGSSGRDVIYGGSGDDSIGGGLDNDTIMGGDGRDIAGGGRGNDFMNGEDGNDVLSGGPDNDSLEGGAGDDTLAGSFGNDVVEGNDGNDELGGGTGRDTLIGGRGNDIMGGGEGDDRLEGNFGSDFIAGGGRSDTLFGGSGSDTLNGGTGNDTLNGGGGADTFVFNELNRGERDVINDFSVNEDIIRMRGVDGNTQGARYANLELVQTGSGVEIRYDGHTIMLRNVDLDDLDRSDFLFL